MLTASNPLKRLPSTHIALPHAAERVVLPGGHLVFIRSAEASDDPAIAEFLSGLLRSSRAFRLFASAGEQRDLAKTPTAHAGVDQSGLLAQTEDGRVVGHGIYVRLYGARAEVAVEVAGDYRPLGLATLLLARLAQIAEQHTISHFIVDVLPADLDRLALYCDSFDASAEQIGGLVALKLRTADWRQVRADR